MMSQKPPVSHFAPYDYACIERAIADQINRVVRHCRIGKVVRKVAPADQSFRIVPKEFALAMRLNKEEASRHDGIIQVR